jgi:hypothetical protein
MPDKEEHAAGRDGLTTCQTDPATPGDKPPC